MSAPSPSTLFFGQTVALQVFNSNNDPNWVGSVSSKGICFNLDSENIITTSSTFNTTTNTPFPQNQATLFTVLPSSGVVPNVLTPVSYGSTITLQQTGTSNFWTINHCNQMILSTGKNAAFTVVAQNQKDVNSPLSIASLAGYPYNVVVNAFYLQETNSKDFVGNSHNLPELIVGSGSGVAPIIPMYFQMLWTSPLINTPVPNPPSGGCSPACTGGQQCINGSCVQSTTCSSTVTCPSGQTCVSGICQTNTPTSKTKESIIIGVIVAALVLILVAIIVSVANKKK